MLNNHKNIFTFIDDWNFKLFERLKIKVSVPISVNYIMFNMDPYQDIEIKHLNMKMFKERYLIKKTIIDENVINEFNKIRNSLLINDEYSFSSRSSEK